MRQNGNLTSWQPKTTKFGKFFKKKFVFDSLSLFRLDNLSLNNSWFNFNDLKER